MGLQTMGLAWIAAQDLKKTVKFYTEVVGLKLMEMNEEWGWAELEGPQGGMRLGIGQAQNDCPLKPGQNAILSWVVDDIEQSRNELKAKGANLIGEIEEVPGHVKIQLVHDTDGNSFNIVQVLKSSSSHEHSGCCGGH